MSQREELLRLMRLSQEDLEANRAGLLSRARHARLSKAACAISSASSLAALL